MGKSSRKTRKSKIILLPIYLLVIILISYLTINNFNEENKIKKENKKLTKEYNDIKTNYKDLLDANTKIEKELKDLSDLDKKINDAKEKVFSLAKNVEKKIQNNETNIKIAYITFDDGPYYLTDSVLKTLKENKVKATFFTIGSNKEKCFDNKSVSCMDTYKKIVDDNHTIANHTYSHAIFYGLYSSVDNFINEVKKQEELIYTKTNVKTNILRFPGGSRTAGSKKDGIVEKLRELGYGWVDWTAQDGDGGDLTSKQVAWSNFKNSINDNIEVILFHDYSDITLSILPDAIKYLEDNNYIILPLFYDSVMINK